MSILYVPFHIFTSRLIGSMYESYKVTLQCTISLSSEIKKYIYSVFVKFVEKLQYFPGQHATLYILAEKKVFAF